MQAGGNGKGRVSALLASSPIEGDLCETVPIELLWIRKSPCS
jgi:hypothetical protein